MASTKLHSPMPFFLLFVLFWGTGILNSFYPALFFPALSLQWVWTVSVLGGMGCAVVGFNRWSALFHRRARAEALIRQMAEGRQAAQNPTENEVIIAGRYISRLTRNADEDLREIKADFSPESLGRLQAYLPKLVHEIENEQDARIRLGVLGAYLGEVACRNFQWEWFFKTDPTLRQFSYLVSVIRKQGRELDPYAWAADALIGKRKMNDFLNELK